MVSLFDFQYVTVFRFTYPDFFAVADDSSESLLSVPQEHERHSWHGGGLPPPTSNIRRLSTASMPARPGARPHHQQRAGSIIMDILPDKLVVPSPTAFRRPLGFSSRKTPISNPSTAKPSPAQASAASTLVSSQMHQPVFAPGSVAQPRPIIQLPSPPSALSAPRVVVVNPTPHPTPPATPHPSNAATIVALPPTAATHLAPPPPRPAFSVSKAVPAVTTSPTTSSLKPSPVIARKDDSAPPGAEPPVRAVSQVSTNEALKLSDRRFFLQTSESPEQVSPSPERSQVECAQDSLELPEPSPASTTSSHVKSVKSDNAPAPPKRTLSKPSFRRGKEIARFTTAKSTTKIQRPTMTRKQTDTKKTTFNIGSASSNGTKADGHGQHLQKEPPVARHQPAAQPSQQPQPHKPSPPKKKGMTLSTDSDYTTDSGDDSDWASEGNSAEERDKEREQKESKLREAAEEARRQRDMFSKLPKRSYTDLTKRTNSGLLTQLLNPDPAIFPPNHPYRQTHSTMDMAQFARQHGAGRLPAPNYQTSRSSAAVPLAAQITPMNAQAPSTNGASAYRPKGRPQGEELETDTEEEGPDNGIQLSTSLAQQKLAALAGPSRRRAPPSQGQGQANVPSGLARSKASQQTNGTLSSIATAPIPLNHPYNLPAPAPPMTPRTTRRQMLSTELSESLRRNLLWERQVSKANMLAGARRSQRLQQTQEGQPVDEREERRRAAMAGNRSWADDFHYAGW